MNTEDFCTYEQALALKKLGFEERCLYYYNSNTQLVANERYYQEEVSVRNLYISYNKEYTSYNRIDAPTLWEVQKWFRKNKQIHVEPNIINENTFRYSIKSVPYSLYRITEDIFNSYEEALSAGITECLKLLNK